MILALATLSIAREDHRSDVISVKELANIIDGGSPIILLNKEAASSRESGSFGLNVPFLYPLINPSLVIFVMEL